MGGLNRGLGKSSLSLCQAEKHNDGTGNKEILYMSNLLSFFFFVFLFFNVLVIIKKVTTFSLAFESTELPILISPESCSLRSDCFQSSDR